MTTVYSDGTALLAAILADPADDTVRLAYADYLQEQGQGDRAEFIRVQVELAGLNALAEAMHPLAMIGAEGMRREDLLRREHELFALDQRGGRNGPRLDPISRHIIEQRMDHAPVWRRGFIEVMDAGDDDIERVVQLLRDCSSVVLRELTCTAADWLAHADAITAAHPVERVTLMTVPEMEFGPPKEGHRTFEWGGLCGYARRIERPALSALLVPPHGFRVADLLRGLWPGITFTLPPVEPVTPNLVAPDLMADSYADVQQFLANQVQRERLDRIVRTPAQAEIEAFARGDLIPLDDTVQWLRDMDVPGARLVIPHNHAPVRAFDFSAENDGPTFDRIELSAERFGCADGAQRTVFVGRCAACRLSLMAFRPSPV